MKYKNRLIIPTLVSTSLLASTIAANAEEVDQNEQYSNQNTEEYAVNDETSETDLDFIDSEEASEEETEDETEDDSEEKEAVELKESEEAETASAEEIETEELDENNIEENIAEASDEPVEETDPAEQLAENEQQPETPVEEPVSEVNSEEEVAVETDGQEAAEQNDESEAAASAEEVETEESAENNVEEEITDSPEESAEQPAESDQEPEAPVEATASDDNSEALTAAKSDEETVEQAASDAVVQENEIPQSEETTYQYDSESLKQELQNLSGEEQTAFLEENADNIEADEELLSSLTENLAANNEEINADEVYAATAGNLSTMSLAETITDINDYIAENNFEVAEIQYDYIPGLPQYAYHSNYGREPENGVVGKPEGVVLHDVGNDNSTIYGEIEYMSRNYENAFVHAFVDANNIIQVADTDYLAYGAGPASNQLHMHVELVRHDNAHDFAKSINNYADYIANLLYKYKLPVQSAEETGEGTLWSHVAVSNHLGGTNSPDPYDYFARFNYEYNDVINLIGERYSDMFNKRTTPQISMPIEQGTADLVAEVNADNLGLYESVTDVRTKNANEILGQQFRVVRTATYNYDDYYLLENEDGVALGWMNAGDLTTSEYVPEAAQEEDLKDATPAEPEVPAEPELEEPDETANEEQAPEDEPADTVEENTTEDQIQDEENTNTESEEDSDENTNNDAEEDSDDENDDQGEPANPENPEEPVQPDDDASEGSEETDDSTEDTVDESDESQNEEEPANPVENDESDESTDEGSVENSEGTTEDSDADTPESDNDIEDESDNQAEENSSVETDDSDQETVEQESEVSEENTEETNQAVEENRETTEADAGTDRGVSSTLEDSATGVRVISETNELEGKSVVVTVMNPSNAIGAAHDLYDIHILDENGSLYSLNNPVTVYLPANGYVSNVYYLGDIGETLEAVNYRTEDGYAVFEVNSFSQYAVVYGNENEDNTTIPPVTGNNETVAGEETEDQTNEHPTVYTEKDVNSEDEAASAVSNDANHDGSGGTKETEAEMLPDTGTAEQSTTIVAAILAALGLGFLVKRRKTTEK